MTYRYVRIIGLKLVPEEMNHYPSGLVPVQVHPIHTTYDKALNLQLQ
jgi:hypothetical protein